MRLASFLLFCSCMVASVRGKEHVKLFDEFIDDMGATGARLGARDGGQTVTVRWTKCVTIVNVCVVTCRNLIGRIEEALTKILSTVVKVVTFIPLTIAKLAVSLAKAGLQIIIKAKLSLEGFFRSIYGTQARVLYGTVMELQEVVTRIFKWGRICVQTRGSQCTQLPHVGGYGPCAGVWPCRTTIVCYKPVCLRGQYVAPGQYGPQGQFGAQARYDPQPQYGGMGQFGGLQRPYGSRHRSDRLDTEQEFVDKTSQSEE